MNEEEKKRKIATALKWLGGLVLVGVISPLTFIILKGMLGLIALGVVSVAALAGLKLAPWVSMKLSNVVVGLIMNEASKNPIETLINLEIDKTKELEAADKAITEFDAEVQNYDDKTAEFKRDYPEEAPRYEEIGQKMHLLLDRQRQKQGEARQALVVLHKAIDKARAIHQMALAALKVQELSRSAAGKVYADIKQQIAFESVKKSMFKAFAELNTSVAERSTIREVDGGKNVPQLVSVPQKLDEQPVREAATVNRRGS
jgi:hypothetical protein